MSQGLVGNASGLTTCAACSAGQNAPTVGSTACEHCAAGFYSDGKGRATCIACPQARPPPSAPARCSASPAAQGKYANVSGLTSESCAACPAGRYAAAGAATVCDPCDIGKYASETGSVACVPCTPVAFGQQPIWPRRGRHTRLCRASRAMRRAAQLAYRAIPGAARPRTTRQAVQPARPDTLHRKAAARPALSVRRCAMDVRRHDDG
jgi:hypothetical protein